MSHQTNLISLPVFYVFCLVQLTTKPYPTYALIYKIMDGENELTTSNHNHADGITDCRILLNQTQLVLSEMNFMFSNIEHSRYKCFLMPTAIK